MQIDDLLLQSTDLLKPMIICFLLCSDVKHRSNLTSPLFSHDMVRMLIARTKICKFFDKIEE